MTIDGGCGHGGSLVAICLDRDIQVVEQLTA
jgi:hypothetical protein